MRNRLKVMIVSIGVIACMVASTVGFGVNSAGAAAPSSYIGLSTTDAGLTDASVPAGFALAQRFPYPSLQQYARMPVPSADGISAVYGNKLYLIGGYGTSPENYLNQVQIYNPGTDSWSQGTPMPTARWAAAGAELNGVIYVFGGRASTGPTGKCEAYDIATNSWTTKTSVPRESLLYMAVTCGSYIYLFIGANVYLFDPAANAGAGSYAMIGAAPVQKYWATAAYVQVGGQDRIYIIGGAAEQGATPTNTNYYYMPATNNWSGPQAVAPYANYGQMREQPVCNGKIYYGFGQDTSSVFYDTLYSYDPAANTWSALLSHGSVARDGCNSGVIGNTLYVVGGRNRYSTPFGLDLNEGYDCTSSAMQNGKITSLGVLFNDSSPAGNVKLGIYQDVGGFPGALLADAGTTAVVNGWATISGLNVPVTPGYYWLTYQMSASNDLGMQRQAATAGMAAPSNYYANTGYGTLPASWTGRSGDYRYYQNVMRAAVTVNSPPTAVNDSYTTSANTPLTVSTPGVLSNDTDADGDTLSAAIVGGASHGSAFLNSNGSFTYTPVANYTGTDSFTYKANDGKVDSAAATVSITIVNPIFGLNSGSSTQLAYANQLNGMRFRNTAGTGTLSKLELLVNDSTSSGKVRLGVYADNSGSPGALLLDAGELTVANGWISKSNLNLAVTANSYYWLAFIMNDYNYVSYQSGGASNSRRYATRTYGALPTTFPSVSGSSSQYVMRATVTFGAGNTPPVATSESYSVNRNNVLTVAAPGVLANDTDANGNALTAVMAASVSHGTLNLNANGSFTYTPTTGFSGADSFTYVANDGNANSNVATVSINVTVPNSAPVAVNNAYSVNEDSGLTVTAPGVLGNDTDADGDALAVALSSGVSHGSLTLNANGSFTYTPAANFNGSDSFTYSATDGRASSNNATVSITISGVNDVPVAAAEAYSVVQDNTLSVAVPGVLSNDSDIDGNSLTAVLVSNTTRGVLALNSNGSFTYTPNAGWVGNDSFAYQANDGFANSNVVTVSITVGSATAAFGLASGNANWDERASYIDAMRFQNNSGTGILSKIEILFNDTTPSSTVRLGVYADSNGAPGALLLDAGEVSVANGWVSISGLNLAVTQGASYWLAFNLQSGNTVQYQSGQAANSHYWLNYTYGPFPAQFSTGNAGYNNNQYVMRAYVTSG